MTKGIYRAETRSVRLVNGRAHINGIERFWRFAKQKLSKFYGIRPKDFQLYLKEMAFRFNLRREGVRTGKVRTPYRRTLPIS